MVTFTPDLHVFIYNTVNESASKTTQTACAHKHNPLSSCKSFLVSFSKCVQNHFGKYKCGNYFEQCGHDLPEQGNK